MGDKSGIQWTDATWSPVTGCDRVSPGCANCYSERLTATRLAHVPKYAGLAVISEAGQPHWTGEVRCHPDELETPRRWKRPRRIFVNSMSDTFHKDVPDRFLDQMFAVMALCPQHTFQVLTKRPERMAAYLRPVGSVLRSSFVWSAMGAMLNVSRLEFPAWPLLNVWLGTSVEDQQRADERIPHLLQCPAAVRFLSLEPLLGPIHLLNPWLSTCLPCPDGLPGCEAWHSGPSPISWAILGGESGPGARECRVTWMRDLVAQLRKAEVATFCKQLGANVVDEDHDDADSGWPATTRFALNVALLDSAKGADMREWPEALRVRQYPEMAGAVA